MQSSKELFEQLLEQYNQKAVSVMVGAGFSKNAIKDYPSWTELLRDMVMELYGNTIKERFAQHKALPGPHYSEDLFYRQEQERIINEVGYLNLVTRYINAKGYREAIDVYIEEHMPFVELTATGFNVKFGTPITFSKSNLDVHNQLLLCDWKNIYTTNYDNLLELTNSVFGHDYEKITNDYELSKLSTKRGLIKVHGDLAKDSLDTNYGFDNDKSRRYVISEEDYATYEQRHQAFSYQMRTGLLTGVFCLIGFSGNDPNFLGWLEWMKDVLDKDMDDEKKEKKKVYLITVGGSGVDKARELFYQNHRIGVIDILDAGFLNILNLPTGTPVNQIFMEMFRYLRNARYIAGKPAVNVHQPIQNPYQKAWAEVNIDSITADNVETIRQLRPTVGMQKTVDWQYMLFNGLYMKSPWTKEQAEMFSMATLDCGMPNFKHRDEEKMKMLESIPEWQEVAAWDGTMQAGVIVDDVKGNDFATYLKILGCCYRLETENAEKLLNDWNPSEEWLILKAALLADYDKEGATDILEERIRQTDDLSEKYRASLLANILLDIFPARYSYNAYRYEGIDGYREVSRYIINNVQAKKRNLRPYGWNGQSFSLQKGSTPLNESFRYLTFLSRSGCRLQYRTSGIIDGKDWYDVFVNVFEYYPYPSLYYSLQLTDKNILKRIGQDYAYSEDLMDVVPDLLKRMLTVVAKDKIGVNHNSCLVVAGQLLGCVSEIEWIDLAKEVFRHAISEAEYLTQSDSDYASYKMLRCISISQRISLHL